MAHRAILEAPSTELIVALPTHDRRAVVQSILELGAVGQQLRRRVRFVVSEGSNIPRSRNSVLEELRRQHPNVANLWVLWLDSDILIFPGSSTVISEAIRWAESTTACVVGNYRMADGQNVVMATRDSMAPIKHYTDDELAALPGPYPEVGLAGLGFAYVPQTLAYQFYADGIGEDIHYWWDHPDPHLHWIPDLRLGHRKAIMLT